MRLFVQPRPDLSPAPLPPLSPDDRLYILQRHQSGESVGLISGWSGRPPGEILAVLERAEERR